MIMIGRVIRFSRTKGYGFIQDVETSQDVFVHASDLELALERSFLEVGELVECEVQESDRGPKAHCVKLANSPARVTGVVEAFDRGFGRVLLSDSDLTVHVHHSELLGPGYKSLEEGDPVEFEIEDGERGQYAARVVRLDVRLPLEKFANLGDFDAKITTLKDLAQKESWEYRSTSGQNPVLWSFLHYTFARTLEQGKIAEAEDDAGKDISCFNTGLVTDLQEEIFGLFAANTSNTDQKWFLLGFFKRSDRRMSFFAQTPELATYFENSTELVYDWKRELIVDYDHVIRDNGDRFPHNLGEQPRVARAALEAAIQAAKRRVKRNYKTAVPQFYRGRVQLLLPLCIASPAQADLAIVVERDHEVYRASTVLTLDMAYNNARLLAKPDREWLDP